MIFDLLGTDNYVSYNVDLAHILGLNASIYISELININRKAIKKQKLKNNYFTVDRKYIEQRTTLKEQDQKDLDTSFQSINVIKIGDSPNDIQLDIDVITSIILEPNKSIVNKISSIVKRGRPTKQELILRNLKSYINSTNEELQKAYYSWIDSVIAKQGWMSKEAVLEGQRVIDDFTNHDLDIALELLKIASIGGYRDINWAINEYNRNYPSSKPKKVFKENIHPLKPQLSEEVF